MERVIGGLLLLLVVVLLLFVLRSVRAILQKTKCLEQELIRDALTGMYNKRYFEQEAPEMIVRAARSQKPICLVYIDCDRFKQINDTYTHHVGDEAIKKIGQVLQVRPYDLSARLHGDEFVLLILGGEEAAGKVLQRIERQLEDKAGHLRVQINGHAKQIKLEISYGVAMSLPEASKDLEELMREADLKMQAYKKQKKVSR